MNIYGFGVSCRLVRYRHLRSRRHCTGFDAVPPQVEAGTLSFWRFSLFLAVFLGLPAGFPALPALIAARVGN